jgi:phage repressor protein C with HTH and peptisase S24 domain
VVFPGGENKRPLPPARTADNDLVDRTIHSRDRTMPVYGRAVGGRENGYEFNGEVVDRVACPPQLQNVRDAYAVFVAGESMEPRYYEGEVLYVHPSRPTPPGSFVVVQLHPEREGDPRPGLVKQLVKKTSAEVVLRSLNPPDAPLIKIPMARVATVHAIVMAGAG